MHRRHFASLVALTALPLTRPWMALAQDATPATESVTTAATTLDRAAFHDQMLRLWEDHIAWTRLYIVSFAANLPDQELTAQRLLRNQTDIGDAIKPFYGDAAGTQLTTLLTGHIQGAVDLLTAAKADDQSAVEHASAAWYANGDDIAGFLHQANPDAWPLTDLQTQMKMHLDLTLAEATARLNGDFAADIAAYDQVQDHILTMADLLGGGIVQQFPDRFA
ncbi:MAG: hypothetical protein U0031_11640 [Thermomicrobiales bacterium]